MSPAWPVPSRRPAAVARRYAVWARRHLGGQSVAEIARAYGVLPATVARALDLPVRIFRRRMP